MAPSAAGEAQLIALVAGNYDIAGNRLLDSTVAGSGGFYLVENSASDGLTIVGSLDIAIPVAQRCLAGHWVSDCDVFVLTELDHLPAEPTWQTLHRPSDVVAVLEDGRSDFPLLVLDIPRELPAWVRPLVARLRESGVGRVHYVLDDDPSDEDLATWHGELGRPKIERGAAEVRITRRYDALVSVPEG